VKAALGVVAELEVVVQRLRDEDLTVKYSEGQYRVMFEYGGRRKECASKSLEKAMRWVWAVTEDAAIATILSSKEVVG
jgi:hypothetical protein